MAKSDVQRVSIPWHNRPITWAIGAVLVCLCLFGLFNGPADSSAQSPLESPAPVVNVAPPVVNVEPAPVSTPSPHNGIHVEIDGEGNNVTINPSPLPDTNQTTTVIRQERQVVIVERPTVERQVVVVEKPVYRDRVVYLERPEPEDDGCPPPTVYRATVAQWQAEMQASRQRTLERWGG